MRLVQALVLTAVLLMLGGCLSDDKGAATAPADDSNSGGVVGVVLDAPQLTLEPRAGAVTVSWPAVEHASGYNLYWRDAYNGASAIDVGTATSYDHTGLLPGATYYYQVAARSDAGEGERSAEQGAVVPLPNVAIKQDDAP